MFYFLLPQILVEQMLYTALHWSLRMIQSHEKHENELMMPTKHGSNWSPRCHVCSALRKADPQALQADRRARLLTVVGRAQCQLDWLWDPP